MGSGGDKETSDKEIPDVEIPDEVTEKPILPPVHGMLISSNTFTGFHIYERSYLRKVSESIGPGNGERTRLRTTILLASCCKKTSCKD